MRRPAVVTIERALADAPQEPAIEVSMTDGDEILGVLDRWLRLTAAFSKLQAALLEERGRM